MTAQAPDQFRYEGEQYSLIGIDGTDLYEAKDFGIETQMASTACWRGYIMIYDCIGGSLFLDGMHVRTQNAPAINGVDPIDSSMKMLSFTHVYENLRLKTKFTGSMLLGKDFIDRMYVHMVSQRAMAYGNVIELQIQDGDIISESDLSERMEKLRNQDPDKGAQPESRADEDVSKWIEDSFSRDYDIE